MSDWISQGFADAVWAAVVMAFVAGMAVIGGAWALWHFVFLHITLGWR